NLRKATVLTLEDMGIPVEYSQHEDAPGQHEIDLRHADALSMADAVMTVRHVVKELAQESNAHATFMPKPFAAVQGSGMHTHFSLFEGNRNAFHDPEDPHNLSSVARGFIAGLLTHAREITAVTNQSVNLYELTPEELLTEGIVALPGSLGEAIYEAERSELVAATLGEHVFEWFIRNKKAEWQEYIAQVTQWEVARYLPML